MEGLNSRRQKVMDEDEKELNERSLYDTAFKVEGTLFDGDPGDDDEK